MIIWAIKRDNPEIGFTLWGCLFSDITRSACGAGSKVVCQIANFASYKSLFPLLVQFPGARNFQQIFYHILLARNRLCSKQKHENWYKVAWVEEVDSYDSVSMLGSCFVFLYHRFLIYKTRMPILLSSLNSFYEYMG